MLTSIGKYSKSFFIKVLVGIIILPFIFWGMGDVFRGGNQNVLVTIDSEKISSQEFINYLNKLNISEEERKNASKSDLVEKILSDYIGRKIISLEVKDLGVKVTDKSLKKIIINDQTFFKDGNFSRTAYEKFLLESSITAPAFEENIIRQEKKRQLLNFLSGGIRIPDFLIENEFKKENQIKEIKYIDLNNYYNNKIISQDEIKKIYDNNKKNFIKIYKNLSYAELKPELLIGTNDYNEKFFEKIDKIENDILDGVNIEKIVSKNNTKLKKTGPVDKDKNNDKNIKIPQINSDLFNRIFSIKNTKVPELINIDNKYFIVEVNDLTKTNKLISDPEVQKIIKSQIQIKDKFENNTKIAKEISLGDFNLKKMQDYANKNQLQVKYLKISSLKENKIFTKSLNKRIFETKNGSISLITDSMLSKNFIIYTEKTTFKDFNKNSNDYEKYKSKARLNIANKIYGTYDKSMNIKYNVDFNNKAISRIKNSF